jgi:hypothetical protein
VQAAAVEGEIAVQASPQPPQLLLSVCSSTHAPAQRESPEGQAQVPLWQVVPPAQAPHAAPGAPVPHCEFV